jgi:ketosteroid isomerase-like protein
MTNTVEREVAALEDARFAAMLNNDVAPLEKCIAADLIYTHSSGRVEDKAMYINSIRSGAVRYKKFQRSEQRVVAYGDSVVFTGRADVEVDISGGAMSFSLRYADLWVKRAGSWQMVMWQATRLP